MQLNPKRRSSARLMLIFFLGASFQLGLLGIASAQGNAAMELTLSQAIDLALKQNRSLKMAQLAVVDSEQKKKIAACFASGPIVLRRAGSRKSQAGI